MGTTIIAGNATNNGASISSDTAGSLQIQTGSTPTTAISISSSQVVNIPNQISFTANTNGAGTFATSNSVITFTLVGSNIGNCYNPSTGRFTATVAGRYLFTAALMATGTGRYYFNLRKNAQNYAQAGGESTNYLLTSISYIMTLAVGDYVDVYITTGTLYNASNVENYFTGHLLG